MDITLGYDTDIYSEQQYDLFYLFDIRLTSVGKDNLR